MVAIISRSLISSDSKLEEVMKGSLLVIALLSLLTGLGLQTMTFRHRTEFGKTLRWFDVRYWLKGNTLEVLTPRGRTLHWTGYALIVLGIALDFITGRIN